MKSTDLLSLALEIEKFVKKTDLYLNDSGDEGKLNNLYEMFPQNIQ